MFDIFILLAKRRKFPNLAQKAELFHTVDQLKRLRVQMCVHGVLLFISRHFIFGTASVLLHSSFLGCHVGHMWHIKFAHPHLLAWQ
jgi:hypothetical protein